MPIFILTIFNLLAIYYGMLICDKKNKSWYWIPFSYWIVKLFKK